MKAHTHSSFHRLLTITLPAVLALTFTGWLSSLYKAYSFCIGWPFCAPSEPIGWLQLLHQFAAAISGLLILLVFGKAWREERHSLVILPLTTLFTIMFFGQIFVGTLEAANPSPHLAILHKLTTISLWLSLGALLFVNWFPENFEQPEELAQSRKLSDFLILTKPWIVALLLVTTLAGMVTAYHGLPPLLLIFWTLLGGALAASGSSALNQYIDHDLDKHMQRTANRPLAAGRLTQAEGLAFGLGLCIASYYILAGLVNLLAAVLSLAGIVYYVFVYSLWLKKQRFKTL